MAGKIEEYIIENKKQVDIFKEECKKEYQKVVEEQEKINIQKSDLNIYRKRLERYFEEFMPNQKVIL